ncbi:Ig-like domain-containing protein [Bermanella marisrubri]|uniref:SbsA Ig-like domain-containing protein n=1 Tax=Bermanella marisrubri TaxID=207949 RepID=Q1N5E7_9GAMM|nr:Ig-like domain-containing protein [Bermanella marisrubri]EAT13176.1 hypothetical protein RED65_00410 [Oceanobacter sp. RED65] [Bermanella marisrubri]QIZ83947.1 Ig-like domain-containing protein [Bermanella marisrubri]
MYQLLIFVFSLMLLAGCDKTGEQQTVSFDGWEKSYLVYSYPFNGQQNVSIQSKVSLMFTHAIDTEFMDNHIKVYDKDGNLVPGRIEVQPGNDAAIDFYPNEPLRTGETYRVQYEGLSSTERGLVQNPNVIEFSTIGVSRDAQSGDDATGFDPSEFHVMSAFPTDDLPFMDFSVLHYTFTQQIDVNSVKLDETFAFKKAGSTESVPGKLLVKDRYIIFDPDEDLTPGQAYTLEMTSGIKSKAGIALTPEGFANKTYIPNDSQPRTTMVQKIYGDPEVVSPLSGLPRNSVPVNSTLMGDVISFARANYYTELAFIPNFPEASPFVIRKGSVIKGTKMPVNIGGEVSGGYDTGEIYLTLITDATGYLINNANTTDKNAPKQVRLVMDVAMTAEDPRANGGLSQDVLHINLFGIAQRENGVLIVDTLGEINPTLLGVEKAQGLVSFFLEAYADQDNAPVKIEDETAPTLQSWLPGDIIGRVDPADAILLIFDEPLDQANLQQEIQLWRNETEQVDIHVTNDGSSVIIRPSEPLKYNSDYRVKLGANLEDLNGNTIEAPFDLTFTTLSFNDSKLAAPLVGSAYPGYNCKLTGGDLTVGDAGRCEGGKATDDRFPIFKLPSNRPINITFNQLMDTDTFKLGENCGEGSIRVEVINELGECQSTVEGSIQYDGSRITFEPLVPWQDDTLYRYTLNSAQSSVCDGSDEVLCSANGLPLRTVPLTLTVDNIAQGSGPMSIPFVAIDPDTERVYNPLSKLPAADVNRNYILEDNENTEESLERLYKNASKLSVAGTGGLIGEAKIGCRSGECEDEQNIYVSGYLPTVVGLYDAENDRIPVELNSQALVTTSVAMHTRIPLLFNTWLVNETGPQIMRMRYRTDNEGNRIPDIGYITWDPNYEREDGTIGSAMFGSTMNVYLDAPGLKPDVPILGEEETNLHSYPLTVELYGPIVFLPDGRMEIQLKNQNNVQLNVEIGDSSSVNLEIRPQDLSINLVSKMVKS